MIPPFILFRRRKPFLHRAIRGLAAFAVLSLLPGCGAGRDEAGKAAMELAEAIYPGQLELYGTYLQKGHYDVRLAVKGDPVTQIRFAMDRNPADCKRGTPCEERLRRAYDSGIAFGHEIRAFDATFRGCGIPALAVHWYGGKSPLVPVIEQRLTNENQHEAIKSIADCVTTFRAEHQDKSWWGNRSGIRVIISSNDTGRRPKVPDPLSFDASVPDFLEGSPAYSISFSMERSGTGAEELQFTPFFPLENKIKKIIAEEVRRFLDKQADDVIPETFTMMWETQIDPEKVDVIRTYVLACSPATRDENRCRKGDVALRVRYDLGAGQVTAIERMPLARDHHGSAIFPPLQGRAGPTAP